MHNHSKPDPVTLLKKYTPPSWLGTSIPSQHIPKHKFNLSISNTPINPWYLKEIEDTNFKFFIKREDLNGSILGGNKIKKLEFSLAKAVENNCNHIITTGSIVSNHCRTTALVCAQLGLKCTMLQNTEENPENIYNKGNLLLSLMTDANCLMIPKNKSIEEVNVLLQQTVEKIEKSSDDKTFSILRGGTQADGFFSGIQLFDELIPTLLEEEITDIVCTSGSGGTAISLALANRIWYENGQNNPEIKMHGVRIWGDKNDGQKILKHEMESLDLDYNKYSDIITYHDDYCRAGYGISNKKIEDLILSSMKHTGVALCTTYTGKTAQGMVDMALNTPEKFKGKNVMLIHTGGIPGLWGDDQLHRAVRKQMEESVKIQNFDEFMAK